MARPAPVPRHPGAAPAPADAPVEVRFLEPAEAGALTAAIEHSYGDTYDSRWVYDVDEVARRLAEGTLRSVVAVADQLPDGRGEAVVGHLGLSRRDADARVGESGQAVVDPAFRGHHLMETLKRRLADDSRARGILGMYSEATAAHPYSQKANLALGAGETGFLLGYIPASVEYTDIEKPAAARRQSAALFYLATNADPGQALHPPAWHREIVARIAAHVGLERTVEPGAPALDGTTDLSVEVRDDHQEAFVTVRRLGEDVVDAVGATTEALVARCDCVYLDLDLTDPATAALPAALHDALGYFFGGVIPHLGAAGGAAARGGDVLRLQHLHRVEADPSDVSVASDFGAELLAYVFERKAGTEGLG